MHAPSQIRLTFNQDHPEPHEHEDGGAGLAIQESEPVLQPPPLYKVIPSNDDYTPVGFVVGVLGMFFSMDREKATKIMLTVHTQGEAVCGLFTWDVTETKVMQVNQYARENQHPLLCEIKKDS